MHRILLTWVSLFVSVCSFSCNQNSSLSVYLQVEALAPGALQRFFLRQNDVISNDTSFRYHVWTNQRAYIYVIDYQEDGTSRALYPLGEHHQVVPNQIVSLPDDNARYRPRGSKNETLCVVATTQPLSLQMARQLRLPWPLWNKGARSRGSEPLEDSAGSTAAGDKKPDDKKPDDKGKPDTSSESTKPRSPPGPRDTRDGNKAMADAPIVHEAKAGRSEVAVLQFRFRHEQQ
jgi:hypothetical protein